MRPRPVSLRRRLLALLVTGTATAWLAIAVATYFDARHHVGRLFDAQLAEYSAVLSAIAGHEVREVLPTIGAPEDAYAQALTYQVFSLDGLLLMRSLEAPAVPLATQEGFSDVEALGVRWRALRRRDLQHGFSIVVAHRVDERDALVRDVALRQLVPLALGLPLLAGVIWVSVARATRPLRRLAAEVRARAADHLDRIDEREVPAEVAPLVNALNQLFDRVAQSFESERRFTGDAAHELRTPLAALRTQAEVALSTAHEERRRHALEQVIAGVERAGRLVQQMLALARLDAPQPLQPRPVLLRDVLEAAGAELRAEAAARSIALVREVEGAPRVMGDRAMLEVLFRNLVENAVRHAPDHGQVRLTARVDGADAVARVEDSGAGVAPELRERIFQRFFRAPGAGAGSGLGLSIARRIAELHHGSIAAGASDLGGLRVEVRLALSKL